MKQWSAQKTGDFRRRILKWYDAHRRVLPWRALPGQVADPYHVWMSEIMLQQTTVPAVAPYFQKFISRWPHVRDLAAARDEDVLQYWAGLGYYARARNLIKCARYVANDLKGVFPRDMEGLLLLPGVGRYTAAAIRSIAFQMPSTVVDGNVERVMARVFAVTDPLPASKPKLYDLAHMLSDNQQERPGDYAQALMDLGSGICTPKSPKCMLCPVSTMCAAYNQGIQNELPAKAEKTERPFRYGHAYIFQNSKGQILLERRPDKGLFGSMYGFPTSEWVKAPSRKKLPDITSPDRLKLVDTGQHVKHVLTHFELRLDLWRGTAKNDIIKMLGIQGVWMDKDELDAAGLPTLFKKIRKLIS